MLAAGRTKTTDGMQPAGRTLAAGHTQTAGRTLAATRMLPDGRAQSADGMHPPGGTQPAAGNTPPAGRSCPPISSSCGRRASRVLSGPGQLSTWGAGPVAGSGSSGVGATIGANSLRRPAAK
jgi:hypothetical protein